MGRKAPRKRLACRVTACRTGVPLNTRTFLGAPPTPRFGVGEATMQDSDAKNAPREREWLFDIVRRELRKRFGDEPQPRSSSSLGARMPKRFREFERGVRAFRRMRTPRHGPHASRRIAARRLWKRLRLRGAAMVLSMRARGAAFFGETNPTSILAKRSQAGSMRRAEDQPAAARNERQRSFIVSGLLFTMRFATHTCRSD